MKGVKPPLTNALDLIDEGNKSSDHHRDWPYPALSKFVVRNAPDTLAPSTEISALLVRQTISLEWGLRTDQNDARLFLPRNASLFRSPFPKAKGRLVAS
jgi:hypothetical protein